VRARCAQRSAHAAARLRARCTAAARPILTPLLPAQPVHHRPLHHTRRGVPGALARFCGCVAHGMQRMRRWVSASDMRCPACLPRRRMRCFTWRLCRWTSARTGRRCTRRC
jgi:hypothetical protein